MTNTLYSVNDISNILAPVFYQYNIRKAILFGSYCIGTADGKSDVDLLVDSDLRGLYFVEFMEAVHERIGKDVDILDIKVYVFHFFSW